MITVSTQTDAPRGHYPGATGARRYSHLANRSPRRAGRAHEARSRNACVTASLSSHRPLVQRRIRVPCSASTRWTKVTTPRGAAADEHTRSTAPQGREGRRPHALPIASKWVDYAAAGKAGDIPEVLEHLIELQQIERSDALKVFRGRRSGIDALRKLTKEGEEGWIRGPRQEAGLHELLKKCPWLIRPELSDYVASDNDMTKVVSLLAESLKIDGFAPVPTENLEERKRDRKRPDLVFILGDTTEHPDRVLVVELKSPNLPLEIDHLQQLRSYMRKVEEWLQAEHPNVNERPRVRGMLIGAMPEATTTADGALDLLSEIRQAGSLTPWEVIGLRELLDRTSKVHRDMITALELDESEGFGDTINSTQEVSPIQVDA